LLERKSDPEDFEIECYGDDPRLLKNHPWIQRVAVMSMGEFFNMNFAFLIYFGKIELGGGLLQLVFDLGVMATQTSGASSGDTSMRRHYSSNQWLSVVSVHR
jgi:hypothetical protein